MLYEMFMFHYQLKQNTGCKLKLVVKMNRHRRRSEEPFYLPRVYPWVTPPMMPGRLTFRLTQGLEVSKTLFFLTLARGYPWFQKLGINIVTTTYLLNVIHS